MRISGEPLHVVAAIIISGGRVLACRRAPHKSSPSLWEFPGGKVDLGELPLDAIVREIREELELDVLPLRTFDVSETLVGDTLIRLECIVCQPLADFKLKSSDHDAFLWLLPGQLGELDWATPDLPAVGLVSQLIALDENS
jgi:8-oxo-dGTP diphosphatase